MVIWNRNVNKKLETDKIYLEKMKTRYEKLQNELNHVAVHKINTWNTKLTVVLVILVALVLWSRLNSGLW